MAGKYHLEELLGSGAMGDVYRATNQAVGRAVAIKVLKQEHAQNEMLVDRFMREAKAANLVRHKNVVDVLDIDKDREGVPFIVQELLSGEDLAKHVARRGGKLPLEDVVDTLCPVIDAVAEAHARGVVHRDIKPENVFLAREGKQTVPKLLDFGISKMRSPDLRATDIGVTMGTPAYMPPEQVQGARDADPRSDVWALGVMLFELLSGRLPFDEANAPALFVAIATKDAPPLVTIDPKIPPAVSKLVSRCLRRKPQERYPSAAELARDLRHVLDGQELEPTGKISIPPSMRVPELGLVSIPKAPPPMKQTHPSAVATQLDAPTPRGEPPPAEIRALAEKILEPARDPSLAFDTAPSAQMPPADEEELPPPPSLDDPRPRMRAPEPPKANRLDAHAALPGVVMAPGASLPARRAPKKEDWRLDDDKRRREAGPDMSLLVGIGVVAVILIGGVGALMQLAHRPEGWPLAAFLLGAGSGMIAPIQGVLGVMTFGIGAIYARRGVKYWRGDLHGGPPSSILSALVAAGVFFAAVELVSAAW
ncbi:MAG TPA: protein kinase [Labilithrix sp.]